MLTFINNSTRWEVKKKYHLFGLPVWYIFFFFNFTFSSTVACNNINNFNCVRWEPQFDSGQLSQRFSWEFLNRATPFQLLSSTLAPLDKCIPKCIAIEVVSISLIDDLFYFFVARCAIVSGSLVFSEKGLYQRSNTGKTSKNTHTEWFWQQQRAVQFN